MSGSLCESELQSSDGQEFKVDEDVAFQSITVKNMIEDTGAEFAVPLPNVTGVTLSKVLEYCNKHRSKAHIACRTQSTCARSCLFASDAW